MKEKGEKLKKSGILSSASTEKGRENVCIALAMRMAEQKLRDGSASNQLILHFLDLATEEARYRKEKLQADTELLKAKKNAYDVSAEANDKYEHVIEAMTRYTRRSYDDEDVSGTYND